jgi:competence protein ComEC
MTGLSPSVVRAATMLSIYTIGRSLDRTVSAWNVVGASVFIMAIWNPVIIFQVGFQFSFAAVAGILLLYQPIKKSIISKHKWTNKLWQMNAVTLSAQLFIVPLSIYYFHQFPSTFLVSSLIAIPLAIMILIGSMSILGISLISLSFSQFISKVIEGLYHILVNVLQYLQNFQPDAWSKLVMNEFQLICVLAGSVSLLLFFAYRKIFYLASTTMIFVAAIFSGHKILSILHQFSGISLSIQYGREMLMLNDSTKENIKRYIYEPFLLHNRIKNTSVISIEKEKINHNGILKRGGHIFFQNNHLIIVDQKMKIYQALTEKIPVDYILILDLNSSYLERLRFINQPKVIVHTTVPPWEKDIIKDFCKRNNLQVHDISKQGAYVRHLKPNTNE